jgi:uncharacterized protein
VATIADLVFYPIKGCRGFSVREATLAVTGLAIDDVGDREWVVVDAHGEFLSQREHPKMALIETRMTGASLRVKAPGMLMLEVPFASEGDVLKVRVWDDEIAAVTQGEIADAWFSTYLGTPARLMRFDPEHTRLASHKYTGALDAPYKFADAFPVLVTSTTSLEDLNARLAKAGHDAVTMERFRPNIVLSGVDAFEEDYCKALQVGQASLRVAKPCVRCTVPGVDPASGEQSSVVPDLLATYRDKGEGVIFGVNAVVAAGAGSTLRVGDSVALTLDL